jgi:hypothetical protein
VNRDSGTASANGGWLRRIVRRHHRVNPANLCCRKLRTSLDRETLTKINPTIEITKPINPKVCAEKAALENATTTPKQPTTTEMMLNLDNLTFRKPVTRKGQTRGRERGNKPNAA